MIVWLWFSDWLTYWLLVWLWLIDWLTFWLIVWLWFIDWLTYWQLTTWSMVRDITTLDQVQHQLPVPFWTPVELSHHLHRPIQLRLPHRHRLLLGRCGRSTRVPIPMARGSGIPDTPLDWTSHSSHLKEKNSFAFPWLVSVICVVV